MTINVAFLGIPVARYDEARAWYERLWGRPPDMIPNEQEVVWQVAEKAWVYVIDDAPRAGQALLTLIVDDLDHHLAALEERGIRPDSFETNPNTYRKAIVIDPAGNTLNFAELTTGDG